MSDSTPTRIVPPTGGPLEIVRQDGERIRAPAPAVHLCRCARSAATSLRDGSHARTGWREDA